MSSIRYRLDRSDKKRTPCPGCGERGCFRPYIDTQSGERLGDAGKCDRENSCNYHKTPSQYLSENGLKPEYVYQERPLPPPKPKRSDWRCPEAIVEQTLHKDGNRFIAWLSSLIEGADKALDRYLCGTYPLGKKHPELQGAMIYYQTGIDGRPRSGKIIQYGSDGKRDKLLKANWLHTVVTGKSMDELGCAQVLFGEHLLVGNDLPVAIVESEKSALICSLFFPQYVWLATGGSHGLVLEKCMNLAGRSVFVFPDKGMYEEWLAKAMDIEPLTASLHVSDMLEVMDADEGSDIADYLLYSTEDGYINVFHEHGYDLFPADEQIDNEVVIPKPIPTVRHNYPPALQVLVDKNPSVAYLCEALDIDTQNLVIK